MTGPMGIKGITISELFKKHQVKIRFLIVGVWNTLFGYGIYCLLDTIFAYLIDKRYIAYMLSMVLSNIIAIINAYIFHKNVTFKSRVNGIKGVIYEFFRFSLTYAVTFCLSIILLPVFVEFFKIGPKIAGAFVIVVCTFISYFGHSWFSFNIKTV